MKQGSDEMSWGMKYNLPERVLREIVQYARNYDLQRVVLFGSRARGIHTERSDIDLAVSGADFDGFYWEVKENLHSLLSVDVVDLDSGISDSLRKEIERDGVVIYEKNR